MDYPMPPDYQPRYKWDLTVTELVWRDHYYFLLQRGYQLRPRYKPGWEGSWLTNGKNFLDCEDHLSKSEKFVLDAMRISDGVKVALKLVYTHTEEIPIGLYFSSPTLLENHRNHCVPILDVIPVPYNDVSAFIVMPLLKHFASPPFKQKVECIEAFYQMLEGLEFMHEHHVAHRDACFFNFVMDATNIIPGGFHFGKHYVAADGVNRITKYKSRKSVGPIAYYWIDFGLSNRFPSLKERRLVYGCAGQEKSVPELSKEIPYDPFKVDIFQLGMTIKRLSEDYEGLEFIRPFIDYLTQKDPQLRPSASEAFLEFKRLVKTLGPGKLDGYVIHVRLGHKLERGSRSMRKKISALKKRKLTNIFTQTHNDIKSRTC